MRVSYQWLKSQLDDLGSKESVAEQLTMAGLEVEAIEPVAAEFSKVVVGQVNTLIQHPDADRLRVCEVDVGAEQPLSIVCGAKNVEANMKVPVALVGARLPGDFKIKKSKLRGQLSEGMICSESELGLADSSDGIMPLPDDAPIGESFDVYLNLDDVAYEIGLTPNRGDCLSVRGLARDLAAITEKTLQPLPIYTLPEASLKCDRKVHIDAKEACSVYAGLLIEGIDPQAKTPLWMSEKLRRCGLRPVSLIVDITNYVMWWLGQPLHAFDNQTLQGDIHVRWSTPGEKIELLDGSTQSLKQHLLITDDNGPIALAGIMGGASTQVTDATTAVFLEAAHFTPEAASGRARQLGMHTDASHRFERGVDPHLPELALKWAAHWICALAGGQISELVSTGVEPKPASVITFSAGLCERMLGLPCQPEEAKQIFERLAFTVKEASAEQLLLTPPSFRFDVSCPADLIEEIARIKGFDAIPEVLPIRQIQPLIYAKGITWQNELRQCMVDRGYYESIHYSFMPQETASFCFPGMDLLRLSNPLSEELAVMRPSLLPGLLSSCAHNMNRQIDRVRLFELGHRFGGKEGEARDAEQLMLAGIAVGPRYENHWQENAPVDFFSVKADLEAIFEHCHLKKVVFKPCQDHPLLHPGQSADILIDGKRIGVMGVCHPSIQQKFKLKGGVPVLFECEVSVLQSHRKQFHYQPISKYPAIKRDLALVVDEEIDFQTLFSHIHDTFGQLITKLQVFDLYQDDSLGLGKKSVALSLILQDSSRTLKEDEINDALETFLTKLKDKCGAVLRE